jgi:hypothetical protein
MSSFYIKNWHKNNNNYKGNIMKLLSFIIVSLILFFSCECPTEPDPIETFPTVDTGFFEITEDTLGYSYSTTWGWQNQWKIVIDDMAWSCCLPERPVWIDSVRYTLWWEEDHPEQNIGFWFAAPIYNITLAENQKYIQFTFPVGWNASVLSCGVFTELHGTVRLKAEIYLKK